MTARQIHCPQCDRSVPAADINIAALLAKCAGCNHVFSIADTAADGSAALTAHESPPSRPSGILHDEGPAGELYLRRRWFSASLFFLLFFCIAWDSFLIFWYAMAFAGPGNQAGGFQWLMIIFPICHVAVGVGLTYYVIAGFLNKTEILVTHDSVHVRHRPVPWWGKRSVPRHEILEVETEFSGMSTETTGTTELQMTISLHHDTGDQIVLLRGLPRRQAEYIAWHLADYLAVPLVRKSDFDIAVGYQRLPGWVQRMLPGGHRQE